jgi:hypothetical protein
MIRCKKRTPGWLFAATILVTTVVARLGQLWPPIQALGLERAAPFAVGLAVVPAAFAISFWWDRTRFGCLATAVAVFLPAALAWRGTETCRVIDIDLRPLSIGLSSGQFEILDALKTQTSPAARILVEDLDESRPGWNWTALIPRLTDRACLGGLDGAACVDLSYCGLRHGRLNDRPLGELSDDDLAEICRVYNIGWVLSRSPATTDRWKAWGRVSEIGRFDSDGPVVLLAIDRPKSFILTGSATLACADRREIVLNDVVASPDGDLLLSFHYQPGMSVSPPTVTIEDAQDPHDPTRFIRLRVNSGRGAARVVIRWDP